MKCLVCNKELPEGVGSCPVCGFPLLYVTSTDGMDDPEIKKMVADYTQKKLGGVSVSVVAYSWKESDDGIVLDSEHQIKLADGVELLRGGEVWLDRDFARSSAASIELNYSIRSGNGEKKGSVSLVAPQNVSFWRVGVELNEGLTVRFLLKSDGSIVRSRPVPLL